VRQFLAAHDEIADLRLHALLLCNAFEASVREMLAWRLSCAESELPRSIATNTSQLVQISLAQFDEPKAKIDKFLAARNAIAHHFHEHEYEGKLADFVTAVLGRNWPATPVEQNRILSEAVGALILEVACSVDETPNERGPFPFPQMLLDLSNRRR
jgi:hypothetical protein